MLGIRNLYTIFIRQKIPAILFIYHKINNLNLSNSSVTLFFAIKMSKGKLYLKKTKSLKKLTLVSMYQKNSYSLGGRLESSIERIYCGIEKRISCTFLKQETVACKYSVYRHYHDQELEGGGGGGCKGFCNIHRILPQIRYVVIYFQFRNVMYGGHWDVELTNLKEESKIYQVTKTLQTCYFSPQFFRLYDY